MPGETGKVKVSGFVNRKATPCQAFFQIQPKLPVSPASVNPAGERACLKCSHKLISHNLKAKAATKMTFFSGKGSANHSYSI